MRLAIMSALAVCGGGAWAGCSNYQDGSMEEPAPQVEICYSRACDRTTLAFECANVTSSFGGFAVGWRVDCDGAGACGISWQGRPIDRARYGNLSCRSLDEQDACWWFDPFPEVRTERWGAG